jgi:phosphatidylserine/phosphatidylglycerophosphate/cardiolipin synthase-like enzyme
MTYTGLGEEDMSVQRTSYGNNKNGFKLVGVILILALVSIACMSSSITSAATQALPASPVSSLPPSSDGQPGNLTASWLQVFFTNPNPPDNVGNGIDNSVVADVNNAKYSIDVTSFDLNLPSFVNALTAASQHNVKVRVVVDGINGSQTLSAKLAGTSKDFDATQSLTDAGITVVNGGRSSGLMHDKITIIDEKILYMGSWNMSYNDTFRNNNNLLRITNTTLIANYQAKFNELFVDKKFGTHAQVGAQTPLLTINGVAVENYFSPVDNVMDKLVSNIQGAQKSIRFMIFTYTDTNLANAMIARNQAGVDTEGVIEDRGASQGAMVPLFCAKVPVKVDGNKYTMHHKVIVIDESTVITGSFNFTKSADQENDDNVLVIHDADLAKLYLQEFDRVWGLGKSPDATKITCK